MEIGSRIRCVVAPTLKDKMLILKEIGYDFLELPLKPQEVDAIDEEYIGRVLALIEETSLPIRSTGEGLFRTFAQQYSNRGTRSIILSQLRKTLDFSSRIGADIILLATFEEGKFEEYAPVYRKGLKDLADYAADRGIQLALENVGGYKSSLLEQLVRYIDHEAIRVYFDIGNCLSYKEDPLETAEKLGDLVAQIHLKGTREVRLDQMPLVPVRLVLERYGYKGRGCLEILGTEGNQPLKDALKILKKAGY